jgi:hypothetical protein
MMLNVLANTQLNRALASGRPLFTQTGPDPRDAINCPRCDDNGMPGGCPRCGE